MKTKEQIEELVLEKFKHRMYNPFFNVAFVEGYIQCQEDMQIEQNWADFENELMDWAHELGKEQKYIPFPSQVLDWLKENYKLPIKK